MKFEAKINSDVLANFVGIAGAIADEHRLSISPDGWRIKSVDPANVAMIDLTLPGEAFAQYDITLAQDESPVSLEVGIDTTVLAPIFDEMEDRKKECFKDVVTYISIIEHPKEPGRHQMILRHGIFTETIDLLKSEEIRKAPKLPEFVLPYSFRLDTNELRRAVTKAQKISDWAEFRASKSEGVAVLTLMTEEDRQKVTALFTISELHAEDGVPPAVKPLLSLDYLSGILEQVKSAGAVLRLGEDYPIRLTFPVGQHGKCVYIQAPRIESE